jgi:GGDEF domain-containing protein
MSAGIAAYPEDADDGTSVIHHADAAMYRAKKNHELFIIYRPEETVVATYS